MKKQRYIFFILLTVIICSCRKMPEHRPLVPQVIEFNPTVQTKAYISSADNAAFQTTGFSVFAEKIDTLDRKVEIMSNTKVSASTGTWGYDTPKVYWGINCDHNFLGIYPYDSGYTMTPEGYVEISSVSNDEDYMYAHTSRKVLMGDTPAPVIMPFKHCLTAITINLKNLSSFKIKSLSNIALQKFFIKATSLKIPRLEGLQPELALDQTTQGFGDYSFKDVSDKPEDATKINNINNKDLNVPFEPIISSKIVFPQNLLDRGEGNDIKLTFTITRDGKTNADPARVINLSQIPLNNGSDLGTQFVYEAGKHYVYNIQVIDEKISCSVTIKNWIDDDVIVDLN